jgi:hypothetical protein
LIRDPPRPPPYRTGFELLVDEVDEQIREGRNVRTSGRQRVKRSRLVHQKA